MTIVTILDEVTKWAQQNICSQIMLKVPPKNTEPNDYEYEYQTANPVAFTMFIPTQDRLPEDIPSAFPSLCVRFIDGEEDVARMKGTIGIQFLLSVWNPGKYSANPEKQFQRNGDGWRDVWNFADIAVRAIEQTTNISGYEIDQTIPVKFGPLTEQEAVPDYYPFWYAWVSFQLTYPLRRNTADIQEFL